MSEQENNKEVFGYQYALNLYTRIIKWLIIVIVVLILGMIGEGVAFFVYESQYADYEETITQTSDTGTNNYVGEDGFIINNK